MPDDNLNTRLLATIIAELTNHFQWTRLIISSTGKHYSPNYEDDIHSGCWNISQQQQFFPELISPG